MCPRSTLDSDWFQASYSGGRIARLWHHLHLSDPDGFVSNLVRRVSSVLNYEAKPTKVRSHYWPVAYHKWRSRTPRSTSIEPSSQR